MPAMEEISFTMAWHGRLMVFAWAVLIPIGIIVTRFFKVLPTQKWPEELDNPTWWRTHLFLHYTAVGITLLALCLILVDAGDLFRHSNWHRFFGWSTVSLCCLQVFSGLLRGSKGGPGDPRGLFGDHYNMTLRRRVFEAVHKSNGYLLLFLACISIQSGLMASHAPAWMPVTITIWWACLIIAFFQMQRRGFQVDTYAAIWGHKASEPEQQPGTSATEERREHMK
ncbi:MAG: cytochrome b561 domain-containing protein [Granulosicoccus sp.]